MRPVVRTRRALFPQNPLRFSLVPSMPRGSSQRPNRIRHLQIAQNARWHLSPMGGQCGLRKRLPAKPALAINHSNDACLKRTSPKACGTPISAAKLIRCSRLGRAGKDVTRMDMAAFDDDRLPYPGPAVQNVSTLVCSASIRATRKRDRNKPDNAPSLATDGRQVLLP